MPPIIPFGAMLVVTVVEGTPGPHKAWVLIREPSDVDPPATPCTNSSGLKKTGAIGSSCPYNSTSALAHMSLSS